jgi:hypothetical protein
VSRGDLRFASWSGAVLALVILGSHPQFTFYAGLLILVWTLPLALEQAGALGPGVRTWRKIAVGLGRWLAAVGWCCLVALALTAVQLLPTLEAARQTTRGATGMPSETLNVLRFNLFGLGDLPPRACQSSAGRTAPA